MGSSRLLGAEWKALAIAAIGAFIAPACVVPGDADETSAAIGGRPAEGADGGEAGEDRPVTWHEDVAPLVLGRCAGCHHEGGIAPIVLNDYATASPFADSIAKTVEQGTMPPWGVVVDADCTPPGSFKDDPSFTAAEIELLREWADSGAPEGDPANAAPVPEAPNLTLEDPDAVVFSPQPITVDGTQDRFLCVSIDPGNTEDVWVTGIQTVPSNPTILHHAILAVDPEGDSGSMAGPEGYWECFNPPGIEAGLLGAWSPGLAPLRMPEGTGAALPAGGRIVAQLHYHPSADGPASDQTSLAMTWTHKEPDLKSTFQLFGNFAEELPGGDGLLPGPNDENGVEFRIPAGVAGHTETMRYTVPHIIPPTPVWALGPHMHYLGVDAKIEVEHYDGETTCMMATPRYGFDWQRIYEYEGTQDEVPSVRGGDRVTVTCTYDNTLNNPYVVRALEEAGLSEPVDVYLGEGTLDEMCVVMTGVVSFL